MSKRGATLEPKEASLDPGFPSARLPQVGDIVLYWPYQMGAADDLLAQAAIVQSILDGKVNLNVMDPGFMTYYAAVPHSQEPAVGCFTCRP